MVAMRIDKLEYNFYFNSCEGDYVLKQHDLQTNCVQIVSFGIVKTIDFINGLINEINEIVNSSKNESMIGFLSEVKQDYEALKRQVEKLSK